MTDDALLPHGPTDDVLLLPHGPTDDALLPHGHSPTTSTWPDR